MPNTHAALPLFNAYKTSFTPRANQTLRHFPALRYTRTMTVYSSDILILGTGLAGLRVARAAQDHNPNLSISLVSGKRGPSGSSFANRNNALGMLVPQTDQARQRFLNKALQLGSPGFMDKNLVRILAEEAEPRFLELQSMGLRFRLDARGKSQLFPVCGDPQGTAAIFDDLSHAYSLFLQQIAQSTQQVPATILGLLVEDGYCAGAWGYDSQGRCSIFVATATVMALGGPAPLYAQNSAGPENPGLALGMLRETHVSMANTGFLQFMWFEKNGQFMDIGALPMQASVAGQKGPDKKLRDQRSTHCPAFHFQEDTAMDRWLLAGRNEQGHVAVKIDDTSRQLVFMAHAGNGGAVIDEHGATSLPGLFAAGECATGMHGANRLGGAMVAATQVFGHRAGIAAVRYAESHTKPKKQYLQELVAQLVSNNHTTVQSCPEISLGLQQHALFMPDPGLEAFIERLEKLSTGTNRYTALLALSALEVTTSMRQAHAG